MDHAVVAKDVAPPPRASDPAERTPRRRGRPDDSLVAGGRVSAWRVEHELGRGGMSSVHAVVHTKFGKRAAIKIAHRSVLGPGGMSPQTFLREARIVHAVEHPAVIDVFATGTYDGRPYLVMEKLIGTPLGRRVDERPLPRRDAIAILLEICDVLRAAHAAGIVHRDLKLDNVFVCDTPFADGRRVKLLDWGVAHIDGEEDPFRGLIAGTLTYVAPEQIRGDALTGAADIYSLAVLAYHLLCRRPPFAGADLALLHMHLRAEPPPPCLAWPEVPPQLNALLLRMLAKQPEDRPSLDQVEEVLRRARDIVDQPVLAKGSAAHIAIPPAEPAWYARWLKARSVSPEVVLDGGDLRPAGSAAEGQRGWVDVLGRPILPVPAFSPRWIVVAIAIAGLAGLANALP